MQVAHLPQGIIETASIVSATTCNPESEAEVIREALRRCGNNRTRVARELGIHRSTLWRKLKTYNIARIPPG